MPANVPGFLEIMEKSLLMKNPELPKSTFRYDAITGRETILDGYGRAEGTGRIELVRPCRRRDLSSFDQLVLVAVNLTENPVHVEMNLHHGDGKIPAIGKAVSLSGDRMTLLPRQAGEIRFPREAFGIYGKPAGWKQIAFLEIVCKFEKGMAAREPVVVNIGPIFGETRVTEPGPRLTECGLDIFLKDPEGITRQYPPLGPLALLSFRVPPCHPYPKESAADILQGRIMGQRLAWPLPWSDHVSGILEWHHFLHRHHFLRSLIQAYLEKPDQRYVRFVDALIQDWIRKHPVPVGSNGGAGPAWETLSAAWRLREWFWVRETMWKDDVFRKETKRWMMRSFWEHARHLMDHEGHPNNWIIVEASALMLAGMLMKEFTESAQWREEGLSRLFREWPRQFLSDGAHFELSPLYHAICLHALLEVKRVASDRGVRLPPFFGAPLEKAADYLAALCRPDFTWPALNDSGGITRDYGTLMHLAGAIFHRPDFTWIGTRGRSGQPPNLKSPKIFSSAGIGVLRSGFQPDAAFLVFRAGPRGFSHQHEDTLSLDFSLHGVTCLVDPGISGYGPTEMTGYYRSASSHNMILIDGKGPDFSGLPPADCSLEGGANTAGLQTLTGTVHRWYCENGNILAVDRSVSYFVPEGKPKFRSSALPVTWLKPEFTFGQVPNPEEYVIVRDRIQGQGTADVCVCWQFAPGDVVLDEETWIIRKATSKGRGMALIPVWDVSLNDLQRSEGDSDPPGGWVSIDGRDVRASRFVYRFCGNLPLILHWILYPLKNMHAPIPRSFPVPSGWDPTGGSERIPI
ncbi:heparinase II/III family protein [Desulfatirhabdium butyrativorans]|uniref:heparinase II/III family protein n=1 Tax=Desulfatirhabdium butyrativorans TaxID=340467 RepID=UPI000414486A|nr:heparinase II/III family protein [Desulfatirhabdium butyrativorans]